MFCYRRQEFLKQLWHKYITSNGNVQNKHLLKNTQNCFRTLRTFLTDHLSTADILVSLEIAPEKAD